MFAKIIGVKTGKEKCFLKLKGHEEFHRLSLVSRQSEVLFNKRAGVFY
jgi:hypothetical protein